MGLISFLLAITQISFASPQEVRIPSQVMDSIRTTYNVDQLELEPEIVDVELSLKVKAGEQKFNLGYTQEVLDLAQYISKEDTAITWKLATKYSMDPKNTNMYFFPRYKPFKSNLGVVHGYNCGTAFKYNSRMDEILNSDALNIMTNGRQYLSILGGDYLVLHLEGKKLKMSYFKVRDSRWTHEMCKLNY